MCCNMFVFDTLCFLHLEHLSMCVIICLSYILCACVYIRFAAFGPFINFDAAKKQIMQLEYVPVQM